LFSTKTPARITLTGVFHFPTEPETELKSYG